MTTTFLPMDADPSTLLPKYTAQQFRQAQSSLYGGGSGRRLGARSGFRVDTPSTVLAATSTTWTLGPCVAVIDPGAATHQGAYLWATDTNITGTGPTGVVAADATNARKDIVYIQVNDKNLDGSGELSADVKYLAGTPSTTPTAPTLPARSFLVGTITVPVAGGGSPTVALNTERFAAAGAPLPVASKTERDALDKYRGLTVERNGGHETWDGTYWTGMVTPTTSAGWTLTGNLDRRGGAVGTQISAAFKAIYGGGTFTLNSSFVLAFTLTNAGYLPVGNDAYGYFMLRASLTPPEGTPPRAVKADGAFTINPLGEVYVRTLIGQAATTIAVGDELSFNTVWNA